MYTQGAQWKAITVAIRLTGLLLNDVARLYSHNLCVISLVMLTFILDISSSWVPGDIISYSFYDL